jgi:sporulation protein YlmC with PRC-barrel domain
MTTVRPDPTTPRRMIALEPVIGNKVQSLSGDDLGNIEEIMLDYSTGTIAYAVLSFGGFLGMGDKLFAVPWSALTLIEGEDYFLLGVDKEVLENAPGFDDDNWPDFADLQWGAGLHEHYGAHPYWERRPPANPPTPVR